MPVPAARGSADHFHAAGVGPLESRTDMFRTLAAVLAGFLLGVAAVATPSLPLRPSLDTKQAAAYYSAAVKDSNEALTAMQKDVTAGAPIARLHADTSRFEQADRVLQARLRVVSWPVPVQPWIDAMAGTELEQELSAARTLERAATPAQFSATAYGAQIVDDQAQIRRLLGLPPAEPVAPPIPTRSGAPAR